MSAPENNGRKLVWEEQRVQRGRSVKAFIKPNKGKKNTVAFYRECCQYMTLGGLSYKKRCMKGFEYSPSIIRNY